MSIKQDVKDCNEKLFLLDQVLKRTSISAKDLHEITNENQDLVNHYISVLSEMAAIKDYLDVINVDNSQTFRRNDRTHIIQQKYKVELSRLKQDQRTQLIQNALIVITAFTSLTTAWVSYQQTEILKEELDMHKKKHQEESLLRERTLHPLVLPSQAHQKPELKPEVGKK